MTNDIVIQEYTKACFSYYFNLYLPKDEDGLVHDNTMYYMGIIEFLEKNFRNDDIFRVWQEYKEEAKKQAKELLKQNRI